MIVVYHKDGQVTDVEGKEGQFGLRFTAVVPVLLELAKQHPGEILAWCHAELKESLDIEQIPALFHHKKLLFSYHAAADDFLDSAIGYAEESIFIKVNKSNTYPTWQMSGNVGAVHASLLHALSLEINVNDSLDYFLNSLAKRAMPFGLLCYSEPRLLRTHSQRLQTVKSGKTELFRFVKQHYKTRWIFLLLLNLLWHERKFPLGAFFKSVFYKKRAWNKQALDKIVVKSEKRMPEDRSIDVIIPTIGRKKHLYDVLKDLSKQTHLPINVIIVEQNPQSESQSELDYLYSETWPFEIKHIFTHQPGACNARNLCLSHTKSNYVFLADDDNRFECDLIEKSLEKFEEFGNDIFQIAYPQPNEAIVKKPVFQYPFFGAGNAFLKRSCLKEVSFDMGFEFGYGEDNDFGMQLRNQGFDVLYVSDFKIVHLKAPMGGFRTKPVLRWSHEKIQPKPSPTIMLYLLKHYTDRQIAGYKTNLLFKFYKVQSVKNPFRYKKIFEQQWNNSVYWAQQLMQNK